MIIFGLIASITIFSALVTVLHEIWPLAVSNVMGFDENCARVPLDPLVCGAATAPTVGETGSIEFLRGRADELFFMILYTIVVFMLAMASFKMIDALPNNILRWMNASVSTFGEKIGDPAGELMQNTFYGMQTIVGQGSDVTNAYLSQGQP